MKGIVTSLKIILIYKGRVWYSGLTPQRKTYLLRVYAPGPFNPLPDPNVKRNCK